MQPRWITDTETAGYMGLGGSAFKDLLPKLYAAGFPQPDGLTGRRDWKAIEVWMDERSGLQCGTGDSGLLHNIEEFRNGD